MSDVQQSDYYQTLGISPGASLQEINRAYRRRIQFFDRSRTRLTHQGAQRTLDERIELLQEAYDTLSDPEKREAYNLSLTRPEPVPPAPFSSNGATAGSPEISGHNGKRGRNGVYLNFFGFKQKPFDLTPDPQYLYLSNKHKEVLAHLVFGLQENNGFMKIIGEVGTGKTTLCRSFLKELNEGFSFAYIIHPCVNSLELLQSINAEFGLPSGSRSKKTLIGHLHGFLLAQRKSGHRVVVIIDEAQDLRPAVLEELRLLSNLETETEKLIQIVLIGQPELDEVLARPELRQLRQRITIQWQLLPLDREETRQYIQHRLNVAGGKGKVQLGPDAADWVFRYSKGIPRMINVLTDRALLISYTLGTRRIVPRIVKQAIQDVEGAPGKGRPWVRRVLTAAAVAAALVLGALHFLVDLDFSGQMARLENLMEKPTPASVVSAPVALVPPVSSAVEAPAHPAHPPVAREDLDPVPGSVPAGDTDPEALRLSRTGKVVTYLASLSLEESRTEAMKWILERWGLSPRERVELLGAGDIEAGSGFRMYPLSGNLQRMATLNYPALLEINLPNAQGTKYLALIAIEGETGIFGSVDRLEIPLSALNPLWNHRALVLWRDFEELPPVMEEGYEGREVIWVQKNLRLLGYFKGREAPVYGPKTVEAVQHFQRNYAITDDGRFDTETKLMIYNLLNIYPTPKLAVQ